MSKIPQIFLDMDDVLVDFDRAVCRLYGLPYAETMAKRDRNWCLLGCLGDTQQRFEDRLRNVDWWANLPELEWCDWLLDGVAVLADRVTIISAPMHSESAAGKQAWLKDKGITDYVFRTDKEALADKGHLLIDDRALNCGRWTMAGGDAVLFPAHGNTLARYTGNMDYVQHIVIRTVEDMIEELQYGIQV